MEFAEATNIAGRMKGFFRAFERLEEVLAVAANAAAATAEAQKRYDDLNFQVGKLQETCISHQGRLDAIKDQVAAADAELTRTEATLKSRLASMQDEYKVREAIEHDRMNKAIEAHSALVAQKIADLDATLVQKAMEITAAETRLNLLKDQWAKIHASLGVETQAP